MKRSILFCGVLACGAVAQAAELTFAPMFNNHMVLQRDTAAPVWGTAAAGAEVRVQISGQPEIKTTADANGNWLTALAPLSAGGPFTLTATSGDTKVELTDVLAGDVWLCAGQSNMEWALWKNPWAPNWQVPNAEEEAAKAANYPRVRLFRVPRVVANLPQKSDFVNAAWRACSPDGILNFSAVGYFFGRDLSDALDIPIGLVDVTWGGSIAETWVSEEKLREECPEFSDAIDRVIAEAGTEKMTYVEKINAWAEKVDPASAANPPAWAADFDIRAWRDMPVPGFWQNSVLPGFNGMCWIVRDLELPAELDGKPAKIHLEMIDDDDTTWFNGEQIGASTGWNQVRAYNIPKVRAGRNRIAVRVMDLGANGGIHGAADKMKLVCDGQEFPLAGNWKFQEVRTDKPLPLRKGINHPTLCYNGIIAPILPLAVKGVIWYQGESNVGRHEQYKRLMPALVEDWRERFTGGEFPFYTAQLSAFGQTREQPPPDNNWAAIRWAQTQIGEHLVENSGTICTIDIGDPKDIHPRNKQDVGARFARLALNRTYGKTDIRDIGPLPLAARLDGNVVKVDFKTEGALQSAEGGKTITGFALAGEDKKFAWAVATVNGKTIDVVSDAIAEPRYVRYAWDDFPVCDLTDELGLPCGSFEFAIER